MILPHDSIAAIGAVHRFCEANDLDIPSLDFRPKKRVRYGFFQQPDTIVVDAICCRGPSRSPYSWTWPGYKADLTVLGVTAHELGHYVNFVKGWGKLRNQWHGLCMAHMDEPPVGSYAALKATEDFAESFKVFVTNPTLLEAIAPARYSFIVNELELKAIEHRHWREILEDSPRHIQAVENRIVYHSDTP